MEDIRYRNVQYGRLKDLPGMEYIQEQPGSNTCRSLIKTHETSTLWQLGCPSTTSIALHIFLRIHLPGPRGLLNLLGISRGSRPIVQLVSVGQRRHLRCIICRLQLRLELRPRLYGQLRLSNERVIAAAAGGRLLARPPARLFVSAAATPHVPETERGGPQEERAPYPNPHPDPDLDLGAGGASAVSLPCRWRLCGWPPYC